MITLSTGVPGAGKTLNTLQLIEKECQGREVYYRGIQDLKLPWHLLTDDEMLCWYDCPDGSVFVIDECQQIWPNLPSNKSSPESVTRLDTHRHRGFDFYIITQKPTMVDFRVRGFVGRHLHYERAFSRNGTRQLEFQKAVSDPDDYHTRQEAQLSRIKFNKAFYDVYKSAEVHTFKPRIPKKLWVFVAAVIATFALGVYGFTSVMSRTKEQPVQPQLSNQVHTIPGAGSYLGSNEKHVATAEEYAASFEPRIEDLPFTAPAYDEVAVVKTFPRPQCIHRIKTDVCKCYTQQATALDISHAQCLRFIVDGWFDPFKDESQPQVEEARAQPKAAAPSGSGLTVALEDHPGVPVESVDTIPRDGVWDDSRPRRHLRATIQPLGKSFNKIVTPAQEVAAESLDR